MGWFHAAYAAGELDLDGEGGGEGTCSLPPKKVQVPPCPTTLTGLEVLYHMCEKAQWDEAVEARGAYFPPTFHKDGKFTRASVFKEGLVDVANHFYKQSPGEWICLELNLKLLLDLGVVVLPQPEENNDAKGEDGKEEKEDSSTPVQCFQIYSGISTVVPGLIKNIYNMKRSPCGNGAFLGLDTCNPISFKARRHPTVKESKVEKRVVKEETAIPGVEVVPLTKSKSPSRSKSPSKSRSKPSSKSRSKSPAHKSKAKPEQVVEAKAKKSSGLGGIFGSMRTSKK